MNGVLNIFSFGIIFIKNYIIQTKIFIVKVEKKRPKKSIGDNNFGTKVVLIIDSIDF
jgi:exopolysaccharide biosynthesis protein